MSTVAGQSGVFQSFAYGWPQRHRFLKLNPHMNRCVPSKFPGPAPIVIECAFRQKLVLTVFAFALGPNKLETVNHEVSMRRKLRDS